MANVEITGLTKLTKKIEAIPAKSEIVVKRHLYQEAEGVMTAAKQLTPVDTGNLRASGHVPLPVIQNNTIVQTLGFGGPAGIGNGSESNNEDVGYAVRVHEDLNSYHKVGHAKFLEMPFRQAMKGIQQRLSAALKKAIK